jgi:hypothetical protein
MTTRIEGEETFFYRLTREPGTVVDVSDLDLIFDLFEKLRATGIFLWHFPK